MCKSIRTTLKADNLTGHTAVITGASGFLGRRAVQRLLNTGTRVIGLDRSPFPGDTAGLKTDRLLYFTGDLNSPGFLCKALKKATQHKGSCFLFHFSGAGHAGRCEADPVMAFQSNVVQTASVLEACRNEGIRRILFPSTALVYGAPKHVVTEEGPTDPKTIYAGTKLAAEAVIKGYAESYGFSCDIARLSNVYGAGGNPDTAVGTALLQARKKGPVRLRTLRPVCDFIHCEDVIEGFLRLLVAGREPGCRIFNLSTGRGTSIGKMAKIVCKVAGIGDDLIKSDDLTRGRSRLVLENRKLVERTGWQPRISVSKGLKAVWEEMTSL